MGNTLALVLAALLAAAGTAYAGDAATPGKAGPDKDFQAVIQGKNASPEAAQGSRENYEKSSREAQAEMMGKRSPTVGRQELEPESGVTVKSKAGN